MTIEIINKTKYFTFILLFLFSFAVIGCYEDKQSEYEDVVKNEESSPSKKELAKMEYCQTVTEDGGCSGAANTCLCEIVIDVDVSEYDNFVDVVETGDATELKNYFEGGTWEAFWDDPDYFRTTEEYADITSGSYTMVRDTELESRELFFAGQGTPSISNHSFVFVFEVN